MSLPAELSLEGISAPFKVTYTLQSPAFREGIVQGDNWLMTRVGRLHVAEMPSDLCFIMNPVT